MKTKTVFFVVGLLLLAVAGGSVSASVLAGVGMLFVGAAWFPVVAPSPVQDRPAVAIVHRVLTTDPLRVYELQDGAGVVVFKVVDGKLTSRFFRSVARA